MGSWSGGVVVVFFMFAWGVVLGVEVDEASKLSESILYGYSFVNAETVTLEFKEDLYMSNDLFCLPLLEENPPPTCLPCSYGSNNEPEGCPSHVQPNSFSNNPSVSSLPPCPCFENACEIGQLMRDENAILVEVTEKRSKVFRYEHNSYDQGFVIKKKAITNYSPTIVVATSPQFTPDKIVALSKDDNILVCPSHPLFGSKDNTITYFITIQPSRSTQIQISIETLPNDQSHGEPKNYSSPSPDVFWNFVDQDLDDGAYMRVHGLDIPDFGQLSPVTLLFPFEECTLISLKTETIKYDRTFWVPDIYIGIVTQTEVDSFVLFEPGVSDCKVEGCFRAVEYLQLESQGHSVSQDAVYGFCPKNKGEQNYINFFFTTPLGDWVADVFVRRAPASPFISSHNIADSIWSHVQIQERLRNLVAVEYPCYSTEDCNSNADFFDYVSRRNFMGPNYFPSLLFPLEPSNSVDMMPTISFQTDDNYYLRCQDRTRDSACGVLTIYRSGDYASPLVYPALEPLYSLDALPSLYAQDLTPLFPSNGSRLTLFTSVGVDTTPIISGERYGNSTIIFSNPNPLHSKSLKVSEMKNIKIADLEVEPPVDCTFTSFHPLFQLISYFHELLQALQRGDDYDKNYLGIDAPTAGLWSYILTWTKEYQSCYFNLANLQTFGTRVTPRFNTTLCPDNNLDDPCCNPRLQWNECCSAENRDIVEIQELPLFINQEFIESNCDDPSCMRTFSEDFREVYQNSISDQICLVNDEITTNITTIFQYCMGRYLGEQPLYGVFCSSNDDCDFLGDPNGYCDLKKKKCVTDPEIRDSAFLGCLIERMESITKTLVYQELVRDGIADPKNATGDAFLTVDLLKLFAVDGETRCFDDYGPLYERHQYFTLRALTTTIASSCPVCDESEFLKLRCLTTFECEAPIQCEDVSENCLSNFVPVSPSCETPAQENYLCNWDNSILDRETCEEEEYKCMYCFNSSYCVSFNATTQKECEATPVCIGADGMALWGVGKEECERRETCSIGGDGTEEECLEQGSCEDPDHIVESIEALIPIYPLIASARNGVCVIPLNPFNAPACPLLRPLSLNSLDFATQRGCVLIGQCLFVAGSFFCPQDPATEEDCINSYGGSWLSLPISNQKDCENPRGVNSDEFPGYCDLNDKNQYLSPKDKSDCEACGGEPIPPARWTTPSWEAGISVQASWRKAEMVPLYQALDSTISYFKLEELFERAALQYETFILWSGESCLVNPFANLIDIGSCNCPTTTPKPVENPFNGFSFSSNECRTIVENEVIGTLWFCPTIDYQIGVTAGALTSLSEYVSGDLCFFSEITLAPISSFIGNRPSEPVTVTNDPNELDPSPVRNQKGASVGVVLGDGIRLELSDNTQPIDWATEAEGVQLTFSVDLSFFEENDVPLWYVLDFGLEVVDPSLKTQPDDEIELQPVGATIGVSVGQVVGNFLPERNDNSERFPVKVDGVLIHPFRYNQAARVYPIARLPDWKDEEKDEALTSGEQAMTGIFAGLYGVAFFATLFFLIKGVSALNLSLLILFLYVLATFSFRAAFWAIVASGDYEETSAGYYILIEPPSFFIVSVLTVLIMSYAFIVAASKGSENLGVYWLSWLALQLFLIAVLFAVVGLMIGLNNNDIITTSCFGRQSSVEENTTIRDIRIAYHSFLLFVAIICAGIVLKLGHDLPDDENKSTLQILSALAGLAVVLTSVLWVSYSAIDEPSPYFVIPLFFTEVPPLLLMGYLTFPSQKQQDGNDLDL